MTPAEQGGSPVDLEFLKDLSDDPKEVREVVELYLQQTLGRIEILQKLMSGGTADEVMRLAHTCAGSSGMYGMKDIAPLFRELERIGRTGDLKQAPELVKKISSEFKRIEAFWETYQKK
jgi:histidine phosphotransfer protein HptB